MEWLGRRGMHWPDLVPLLFEEQRGPPPHLLVLHLGGNDLGFMNGKVLVIQAHDDIRAIQRHWPGVLVLWSAIIPWLVWWGVVIIGG